MNKHIIGKYIVNKCIRYISMMFMAVVILFNFTPKAEAAEWIWARYGYLSTVKSSTVGADGRIWFCGNSFYYENSSEIAGYTKDNIISSGVWPHGEYYRINTIVSDLDGNIWAGGTSGSVACWRNTGGCPVIASLSGVDMVLIVAEPSISGISDMERIINTAAKFGTKTAVCINKYDTNIENTKKIEEFCKIHRLPFIGSKPPMSSWVFALNSFVLPIQEVKRQSCS
jgi:hypothetical protein